MLESFKWTGSIPLTRSQHPRWPKLDGAIRSCMVENNIVGCAVGVIKNFELSYVRTFGWSTVDDQVFTLGTSCRVGSISKSLTGMAVLMLAESGLISLDDFALEVFERHCGSQLPFVLNFSIKDSTVGSVTVRDLLNHTSGWERSTPYTAFPHIAAEMGVNWLSPRDIVRYALETSVLTHIPGEVYEYANINFGILGLLVEAVTGIKYERYVRRKILDVLGIKPANAFVSKPVQNPNITTKYRARESHYYQLNNSYFESLYDKSDKRVSEAYGGFDPESMAAGGGWAMNINALAKFWIGINADNGIVSNWQRAVLCAPAKYVSRVSVSPNEKLTYYNSGLSVTNRAGVLSFGHSGMLQHAGALMQPLGDEPGSGLVILSNCNMSEGPWVETRLRSCIEPLIQKGTGQ